MAISVSEELMDFLREETGQFLRSVIHYTSDDYEILYLREDIESEYQDGDIEQVINNLRMESIDTPRQEQMYVHGRLGSTIRVFEDAVEIHLPHDDYEGTAIALDPEATYALHTFVGECLNRIDL